MNLFSRKKIDFQHIDERGSLTQLVHDGFKQINVLQSNEGTRRGAHFHKRAVEAFYVFEGSVEVTLWNINSREVVIFKQGDFFEIHPYILHDMFFPEYCLMIQMYDIPIENDDGTKDIFTEDEYNA